MTERERAARALLRAEIELQRAVQARLRFERGSRERLTAAKVMMAHAHWRACRALCIRPSGPESRIPDYGLARLTAEAIRTAMSGLPGP